MAKILTKQGKGKWTEVQEPELKIVKRKKRRKTKCADESFQIFFDKIHTDIIKNGYRSQKISSMLKYLGIQKRSINNEIRIREEFAERGFFAHPEYKNQLKFDSNIRIYNYCVTQLGDLFENENALENYVFDNALYKKLGIDEVERQHSPKGSKDRLDFKGKTTDLKLVVLELKNGGGGKSAVEQVLRYTGLLTKEFPKSNIRQILVTGVQNYETALAIRGLNAEQRESFEWYLYKYKSKKKTFDFKRITQQEIFYDGKADQTE